MLLEWQARSRTIMLSSIVVQIAVPHMARQSMPCHCSGKHDTAARLELVERRSQALSGSVWRNEDEASLSRLLTISHTLRCGQSLSNAQQRTRRGFKRASNDISCRRQAGLRAAMATMDTAALSGRTFWRNAYRTWLLQCAQLVDHEPPGAEKS